MSLDHAKRAYGEPAYPTMLVYDIAQSMVLHFAHLFMPFGSLKTVSTRPKCQRTGLGWSCLLGNTTTLIILLCAENIVYLLLLGNSGHTR